MSSTPSPLRYSDLSLKDVVCLCAGPRDDEAWQEFASRVGRPISLTIMRTASLWGEPSRPLVEDLVQATYLKLWEDSCRLLRDFAVQHPEAVLGYIKKIAANVTHDHFKHVRNQSSGGEQPHVSTSDVDPEAGNDVHGSEQKIAFGVLLSEIDEYLRRGVVGLDQERDRAIFRLYFRQGMSTKEIASLPTIGLGAKGVGSVIERLKHCIREHILKLRSDSNAEEQYTQKQIPSETYFVKNGEMQISTMRGIGPWSSAVIDCDSNGDFRRYPIEDMSGLKIKRVLGVDLCKLAVREPQLAADVYVYAASFLESQHRP